MDALYADSGDLNAAVDDLFEEDKDEEDKEGSETDPAHLDNFPLSDITKAALRKRGIETLFPIQANVLRPAPRAATSSVARAPARARPSASPSPSSRAC